MARTGITYQDVAAVAERLKAAGGKITIQTIRGELGTGSPNTIHRHLAAWRDNQPAPAKPSTELPQAIQTAILKEIETQTATARAEQAEKLASALEESAELAEESAQLEEKNAELAKQITEVESQNNALSGELKAATADIERLRKELAETKAQVEEHRIKLAETELKKGTIKDLKAEVEKWRAAATEAEKQAAVATALLQTQPKKPKKSK